MAAPASTTEHVAEVPKQNKDKVYIGNLSYKTTEESIREFVAAAGGNVTSVVIPLRFGKRPSGFALVQYDKEEDAAAAVGKLQDKELDGRKIRVQLARPDEEVAEMNAKRREEREAKREADKEAKKAAAAERAAAAKEKEGAAAVTEGEGAAGANGDASAKKPRKKSTKTRTSRRRVPGEEGEDTEDAAATDAAETAADGTTAAAAKSKSKRKPKAKKTAADASEARIDGGETTEAEVKEKPVREKKERKPREKKLAPSGEESKDTLFVSNLPYDIDDDALASIFTNLSIEIKSAKVIRATFNRYRGKKPVAELERPARSRGFGFVEVANPAQRDEAVEKAAGTLVASREIGVKVAKEMQRIDGVKEKEGGEVEAPTTDLSQIQGTPEKATA